MGVVTDFSRQRADAQNALQNARGLMRKRPAEAFDLFRTIAQAYPFEEDIRDDALRISGELEDQAIKDIQGLETALNDFRIYASPDALLTLQGLTTQLEGQFLSQDEDPAGQGPIVERVAELVKAAHEAEHAWQVERAMPALERLERLIGLLENSEAYRPLAAVYAQTVLDRYKSLAPFAPDVQKRVAATEERLNKLLENETVRNAIPPKAN